ncbi:MAG: CoA-binding protein, partial [Candidatus Heimdallarchaeota archaeon]|nr:CoA-binding protein [Candidatus Heimdallarchaeota archaeon]
MNIDTLSTFFNPKSVAIVGASNTKGKVGFDIVNNLKKFNYQGNIYPINPKENMIQEIKSYKSLEECPSLIELVFIAIPAKHVINIIDQMGKLQIRFVVIISAGFKEVGHEGILLENQLLISLRSNNVRAIGPNCLGLLDTHTPLNGSFASRMPLKGNLGFISQSGALITGILDWSLNEGLGFSKFISVGNKVDIDEVDLISALAKDDQTKAILAYLESIERGRKFIEFASSITRKKPIIVIKSGISKAGARAASSHTGSMSGTNTAYEIAFKKSGVIQAKNVQELFDMAVAISSQPLPQSSKICIITNAGGPGIIATDAAEFAGLELSNLDHDTIRALQQKLPMAASTLNPIDVLGTGSADDYFTSLDLVLNDSNVSMVLIIVTPQGMTQPLKTAEAIVSSKLKYPDKPIVSVFMGGVDLRDATQFLKSHKLPCFTFPERGINALSGLWRYSLIKNRPVLTDYMQFDDIRKDLVSGLFKSLYQKNRMTLLGSEAIFVAQAYNIPCPSTRTAFTVNEAIKIAIEIGYPVAMKVSSPEIIHKTDFGGIFLNVQTEEDLSL